MTGAAKIIAVCPECGIRLELEEPCGGSPVLTCPVCSAEIALEKISRPAAHPANVIPAADESVPTPAEPEPDIRTVSSEAPDSELDEIFLKCVETDQESPEVSEPGEETLPREPFFIPVSKSASETETEASSGNSPSGTRRIWSWGIIAAVGLGLSSWGGYVFFKTFRIVVRPIPDESKASAPAKTSPVSGPSAPAGSVPPTAAGAVPAASTAPDGTKQGVPAAKPAGTVSTAAAENPGTNPPVPGAGPATVEKNGAPVSAAGTGKPVSTAAAGNPGAARSVPVQKTTAGEEKTPVRKSYPAVKKPSSVQATPEKLLAFLRNWEKVLEMARKGKEIRNEPLLMNGSGPLWMNFSDIGRTAVPDSSAYMRVSENGSQVDVFALTGDLERFEEGGGLPVITMQVVNGNYTTDRKITISYWKRTLPPGVKAPVLSAVTEVIADGVLYPTRISLMQTIRQMMGPEASRPKVCIVGNSVYVVYLLSPSESLLLKEGAITIKITGCFYRQTEGDSTRTAQNQYRRKSYSWRNASPAAPAPNPPPQASDRRQETALVFDSERLARQASFIMERIAMLRESLSDSDFGSRSSNRTSSGSRSGSSSRSASYHRKAMDNAASESERESPSWRIEKQLRDLLKIDDETISELRQSSRMNTLEDIDRICNGKIQKKLESYNILKVTREIIW